MHLKRLELQGFKSFPDRIVIRFESGITAIVGPNGSGKSNVADAIRWVLGEQSAKQLRGTKMEDVIFNGTQRRKPQSYCEVSLVFDNEDHALGIDYTEVAVTRRMYRDGKSEYYINKNGCRLRDVIDLFRDTGIGKEGYSIIGQGRIDEILSNKAEDRRAVFEEASGVAKYKADRAEALRSLARTQDNLVRIDDILEELRAQVEPLKEQSETAKRYLKLRDDLRYEEVNLFLVQAVRNQQRVQEQQALAVQLEEELASNEREKTKLRREEEALFEKVRAQEESAVHLRETMVEAAAQEQSCRGEIKLLRERIAASAREKDRLNADGEAKKNRAAQIKSQIEALENAQSDNDHSLQRRDAELAALQSDYDAQQKALEEREAALEHAKAQVIVRLNRMSDLKSRRSQLETMQQSIRQRKQSCAAELDRTKNLLDTVSGDLTREKQAANEARDEQTRSEAQRNALLTKLAELTREERAGRDEMHRLNDAVAQSRARLKMLEQMKRDYEGFYSAVRNLLRDADSDSRLSSCVCGVVAEVINVPQKYEKAVEVALGAALQNIITPDEASAKRLIEHLRAHQYGRATFLPLSGIQSRSLNAREAASANSRGGFGAASELLTFDEKYRPAIENLLGRVVIAEDLDAGIRIARENRYSFRIVTLAGDVLNSGGSMTGGSLQSRSTSILSRDRQIEDEQSRCASMQRQIDERTQEVVQIAKEAQQTSEKLKQVEEALGALRVTLGQHEERVHILSDNEADRRSEHQRMQEEMQVLMESLSDVESELSKIADTSRDEQTASSETDEDISAMQQALYAARGEHDTLRETISALRIALSSDKAEKESISQRRRLLGEELSRIQKEQETSGAQILDAQQNARRDEELLHQKQQVLADITSTLSDTRSALDAADAARRETNAQTETLSQKRAEMEAQGESLTQRLHKAQIQKTRLETELEVLHARIWNDYELTFASAQPLGDENFQINGAPTRVSKLKADIRALGDVNVGAIEQYETVSERVESLSAEREDLTCAKANLEEVIAKFEVEIKERFKTQFELINENFKIVFSQLFNGGTAELRLSDPDDLMETGIEIAAQPPGKKLQALSLLSGGERTLTAIALLFAMLNIKPTPFCVLDEIEAALDEANTGMYAEFLKEYSQKTQFVIITHKKESMEVSDAMYGIAMQERGISSLVSVKLTEADAVEGA